MALGGGFGAGRGEGRGVLAQVLAPMESLGPQEERPAGATAGVLAPDVRAWVADPEQGVAAAIDSVDGADATREALAHLAPSQLTVAAAVMKGGTCWAELTRRGDAGPETCLVGLTLGATGLVRRLVLLRAPLVPPVSPEESTPSARPILEGYFDDLMNSRFREAAAHFSVDTLYSHPPYAGGSKRVLFSGRDALWRGFAIERGPSPARQVITGFCQQGGRAFIEGVIEGTADGGTFFSTAQIDSNGEIARYVAFYSARRIPSA
jgi:hypothetical protein